MPFQFVGVRARLSSSPTEIPSSVTNRMQFDHMTRDTSQGPSARAVARRPVRHLMLELVIEFDGEGYQCLGEEGRQGQVRGVEFG